MFAVLREALFDQDTDIIGLHLSTEDFSVV